MLIGDVAAQRNAAQQAFVKGEASLVDKLREGSPTATSYAHSTKSHTVLTWQAPERCLSSRTSFGKPAETGPEAL